MQNLCENLSNTFFELLPCYYVFRTHVDATPPRLILQLILFFVYSTVKIYLVKLIISDWKFYLESLEKLQLHATTRGMSIAMKIYLAGRDLGPLIYLDLSWHDSVIDNASGFRLCWQCK